MSPRMITISFRGRKFTLEEIPSSLLELLNEVELVFAHELPPHWALQYTDIDGDRVMLTTQNDFEALTYECQNSLDSLALNIVSVDFELSFEKNQGSGLGSRENSELEFEDSFNVVEEDKESEPKDEVADLDFSDVVTEEDQNEKEISILKVDYSPEKDKRSTSGIEASPSSIIAHEQDIVIQCRSPVLILEQASQTEIVHHASRDLQMLLVERGSQTMSNARENGSTQDKNIQTALQARESQAQEQQVNLDSKDLSLEKENICPNIYRPQRVVVDNLEDKSGIKAQRVVKTVHNQCYCDGCGMCPIIGVRYRCSVCEDFDFCERCEATKEHPHLFLRIKNPQEYSKIKHNNGTGGGKVVKVPQSDASVSASASENEFSFKDLRRKFKETTFAKVMSNTYGQLPEQAMQTLNKLFSNIKTNISKVVDESSSEEEEEYEEDSEDSFDEYEISSRDDVLPTRGKSLR